MNSTTEPFFSEKFDFTTYANGVYTMGVNVDGQWIAARQFKIQK